MRSPAARRARHGADRRRARVSGTLEAATSTSHSPAVLARSGDSDIGAQTRGRVRADLTQLVDAARRRRGAWPALLPARPPLALRAARSPTLSRMPNALAQESSPYLRQHAHNPVDWLPWGPEALARARDEDRPLLVSIGYSACHWCHVMERESFEDDATAALMNESFVCVKVDREERPDVDAIYMEAVQAMTGHGGWPMNVFLTPDSCRSTAAPTSRRSRATGCPSWPQVLQAIAEAWSERARGDPRGRRAAARAAVRRRAAASPPRATRSPSALEQAVARLSELFDPQRRLRRRAEVPASLGDRVLLRGTCRGRARSACAEAEMALAHAARDGPRRHPRPARRRLSPLLRRRRPGWCRTSRRCSTTTRCSRAPTCTASSSPASQRCSRSAARRSTGRCARCAAPRAASTPRSTPTPRASRALLRLDAWRECAMRSATTPQRAIAWFGASEQGNFEDPTIRARA